MGLIIHDLFIAPTGITVSKFYINIMNGSVEIQKNADTTYTIIFTVSFFCNQQKTFKPFYSQSMTLTTDTIDNSSDLIFTQIYNYIIQTFKFQNYSIS